MYGIWFNGNQFKPGFFSGVFQENEASGVQSDSQRMYVRQMYPASRLYHVTADHTASQIMDVTLPRGTLVGIIKEGDPMGNKERWFVDNGGMWRSVRG